MSQQKGRAPTVRNVAARYQGLIRAESDKALANAERNRMLEWAKTHREAKDLERRIDRLVASMDKVIAETEGTIKDMEIVARSFR